MITSKYSEFLANITQAPSKGFNPDVFTGEGIIVDLKIKRWRGKAKIEGDELGLQEDLLPEYREFSDQYIGLGQKLLLPVNYNEKISAIEVTARTNLKDYSYQSPWGPFVPYTSYDLFMEVNERCKEKFFRMRDEVDSNYEEILTTIEQDYATLALVVFKRMQNIPLDKTTQTPKEFVDAFLQSIMDQIPPRDRIYDSFLYETTFMSIPDIMMSIKPEDTKNTQEKLLPSGRTKADVQNDIQKKIIATTIGPNGSNLDLFIETVVSRLREIALDSSSDIIKSIDKNDGKIVGRTSVKAKNLVEKIRTMDFYGDNILKEYVDKLEEQLLLAPKDRSLIEVRRAVEDLKTYSESSLAELATLKRTSVGNENIPQSISIGKTSNTVRTTKKTSTLIDADIVINSGVVRKTKDNAKMRKD